MFFIMKTLKKLGLKRSFFSLIKGTYKKLTSNIILKGATLKDQGQDKGVCFHHFYSTLN